MMPAVPMKLPSLVRVAHRFAATVLVSATVLSGCVMRGAEESRLPPSPGQAIGTVRPAAPVPVQPPPAPRQLHLGTASRALVAQAYAQAKGGDFGQASATIERALRIEPENALLWIELGRMRLGAADAEQADGMGRKALSLASGDPAAQASAWRLIADSLQARGRTSQAADAARRADGLAPR